MPPKVARTSSAADLKAVSFPVCKFESDLDKATYNNLLAVWLNVRHSLTQAEQRTFYELVPLISRPRSSTRCAHHAINKQANRVKPFNQAYYHVLKEMFGAEACMKQPWWSALREKYPVLAEEDEAESSDSESESDSDDSELEVIEVRTSQPDTTLQNASMQKMTLSDPEEQDHVVPTSTVQEKMLQDTTQDALLQDAIHQDTIMEDVHSPVEHDLEEGQIYEGFQRRTHPERTAQQQASVSEQTQSLTQADKEAIISAAISGGSQKAQQKDSSLMKVIPSKRPPTSPPYSPLTKRRQSTPGPSGRQSTPGPSERQNTVGPSTGQSNQGPSGRESIPGPYGRQSTPGPSGSQYRSNGVFLTRRPAPESANPQLQERIRALENQNRELHQKNHLAEANVRGLTRSNKVLEERVVELKEQVASVRDVNMSYGKILRQFHRWS